MITPDDRKVLSRKVDRKTGIKLNREEQNKLINDIQIFFREERNEEIGIIAAETVMDFFMENLGIFTYNKSLDEAKIWFSKRMEDISLSESRGIGTRLIESVIQIAKIEKCKRVWLVTMNDNTHAIRYYQKRGFSLKGVHINAFEITKKIKGIEGECLGIDNIPILHEFEFEIIL